VDSLNWKEVKCGIILFHHDADFANVICANKNCGIFTYSFTVVGQTHFLKK
jgi:hypothetical protein